MTQEQDLAKLRADLAEAKRKARQYENRVKVLTNNQRDKECRIRTRRLIEHGAILESILPVKDLDGEEIKALLRQISSLPVVSKLLEPYEKDGGRETFISESALIHGSRVVRPGGAVASFGRDGASPKPLAPPGPDCASGAGRR